LAKSLITQQNGILQIGNVPKLRCSSGKILPQVFGNADRSITVDGVTNITTRLRTVYNLWKTWTNLLRSCGSAWEISHWHCGKYVESLGNTLKSFWCRNFKKYRKILQKYRQFCIFFHRLHRWPVKIVRAKKKDGACTALF
jgi:hypothetical protein